MSDIEKSYSPGLATDIEKPIANPGIEPHRIRMTDKSEKHARTAEKQIAVMFGVSVVGAIIAVWGFFAFPIVDGDLSATRNNSLWMGLGHGPIHVRYRLWCRALGKDIDARQ